MRYEGASFKSSESQISNLATEPWVEEPQRILMGQASGVKEVENIHRGWAVFARVACFFGVFAVAAIVLHMMITVGLRQIKTGEYGASNQAMQGKVNAQIVITGSSRAVSHFDPRVIEQITGKSAFNLGRNGSQTDIQVAVLKAYLEHNKKPEIVIHNLDAFSYEATREVYDPELYVPYLYDEEVYKPLQRIDPEIWKSRYLPIYGYVAQDMKMSWILGLRALFGWSPREEFFLGFNPRPDHWSNEFQSFEAANPNGVNWPIDAEGEQSLEELARLCKERGIQLIFVYSPEYSGIQKLTNNRAEIFSRFSELSDRYHVPLWDYSNWKFADDTALFQNSQHLNTEGAEIFSSDLARRLEGRIASETATDDSEAGNKVIR